MSTPKGTCWNIEEHTKVKHEILRRYLGAWFNILGSSFQRIQYIDGFSGPGRYSKGEEGSPIIALKQALHAKLIKNNTTVNFLFIEKDKDRYKNLCDELNQFVKPQNFSVTAKCNDCFSEINQLISGSKIMGLPLCPTFAFIDPFGYSGIPFKMISQILAVRNSEVFITFMRDSINRFLDALNPINASEIRTLLDANNIEINRILSSGNREKEITTLYQSKLKSKAKFVAYFEMKNEQNKVVYQLFFATNNKLGFKKMKNAFWSIDKESGYTFSDRTNPLQPIMIHEDNAQKLANDLLSQFCHKIITGKQVIAYVEEMTNYTESHAKKALTLLESQQLIKVDLLQVNGKKRRGKSFTENVIIHF